MLLQKEKSLDSTLIFFSFPYLPSVKKLSYRFCLKGARKKPGILNGSVHKGGGWVGRPPMTQSWLNRRVLFSPGGKGRCAVCGDAASGTHYRVLSCEGCKGFWRRTIQRGTGQLYKCRTSTNNCTVNTQNRGRCQRCRSVIQKHHKKLY